MKTQSRKSTSLVLALVGLALSLSPNRLAQAASWLTNSPMNIARDAHTATLLLNGKVLVAGGGATFFAGATSSAELYDPTAGTWVNTALMSTARRRHTATLLPNGKVIVVGGRNDTFTNGLSSVELYDPATETWTNSAPMSFARYNHTATLLANGKLLVVAGDSAFRKAELYDPANGAWTPTGDLNFPHQGHTATLMPDGRVMVVGGGDTNGSASSTVEMYDPGSGNWTLTNALNTARFYHTASLLGDGRVLVCGGGGGPNPFPFLGTTNTVEIFDPMSGTWTTTNSMNASHVRHTATLLSNGKVLIVGTGIILSLWTAELFDPSTGTWSQPETMNYIREGHTATMLANGRVLIAGGNGSVPSSELYDYSEATWTNTGPLNVARDRHTATLLPSGEVLVAGGRDADHNPLGSAELYAPTNGNWVVTGTMNTARYYHTAILLPNGKVLVVGGEVDDFNTPTPITELFDPTTGMWTTTGPLATGRLACTATLMPNGKVLVAGGSVGFTSLASAEVYDPASGLWRATSSMGFGRSSHQATLLANGKILVSGGFDGTNSLASAELYDPASETWTATGAMTIGRLAHLATLLANGKVLAAHGLYADPNSIQYLSSAEEYDPATGTWTLTDATQLSFYTMTQLPNGMVLTVGHDSEDNTIPGAELFDPASGTWRTTSPEQTARRGHTATLLRNGQILITGGKSGQEPFSECLSNAELYDVGLGFDDLWQPQITAATSPLGLGGSLAITGSGFRGISGGSSGKSQDSPTDYPLVQLRSIESGQTTFLLTTNWSPNPFTSLPVWNFPPGWALATVFVNGIPSTSAVVNVTVPVPTAPTLTDAKFTNDSFQFAFTNSVGALFGALATTNPALPLSNWTALGGVTEISPGQFHFSDPQATDTVQRFYSVRSP